MGSHISLAHLFETRRGAIRHISTLLFFNISHAHSFMRTVAPHIMLKVSRHRLQKCSYPAICLQGTGLEPMQGVCPTCVSPIYTCMQALPVHCGLRINTQCYHMLYTMTHN